MEPVFCGWLSTSWRLEELAGYEIMSLISPTSVLPRAGEEKTFERIGAGSNSEPFGCYRERHCSLEASGSLTSACQSRQKCLGENIIHILGSLTETLQLPGILVVPGVGAVAIIMAREYLSIYSFFPSSRSVYHEIWNHSKSKYLLCWSCFSERFLVCIWELSVVVKYVILYLSNCLYLWR